MTFLKVGGSLQSNSKVSSASLACQGSLGRGRLFFGPFFLPIVLGAYKVGNVHKVGVLSEI